MIYDNNPFKLLGISPSDGRREIVRQAEEKSLLLNSEQCSEARTILTNPQRRISAEVHWFLDCDEDAIREIESYITDERAGNSDNDFSWDRFSPLTQLNIQLACLESQDFSVPSSAKFSILRISRLFESIDADSVLQLINEKRHVAGFPEVSSYQDIEAAISDLRSEIRQGISQKMQSISQQKIVQIVTMLSESYSGNQRYKGNAVLEDVLSEYQLYINDTLHKQGQSIIKTAQFIEQGAAKINVDQAVADLIELLYAWDKLAQPLQLGALTKGSSHEESVEMLEALRNLALKLHNDYGFSSASLAITKATQEVFKELPEYAEMLKKDNKVLTKLINEKAADEIVKPILESVNSSFEAVKTSKDAQRESAFQNLLSVIKVANQQIKDQYSDKETANELRSALGMLARSFAVQLHNDLERTEDAARLIHVIEPLFNDLPEVAAMINEDKKTLERLEEEQKTADKMLEDLKSIESAANSVKNSYSGDRASKISVLLTKMREADTLIKNAIDDKATRENVRMQLASIVRSVGIELHNEKHDTRSAQQIMQAVANEFSDLPKVMSVAQGDLFTLNQELSRQVAHENSQKVKSTIGIVLGSLFVLGLLINAVVSSNSGSPSSTRQRLSPPPL